MKQVTVFEVLEKEKVNKNKSEYEKILARAINKMIKNYETDFYDKPMHEAYIQDYKDSKDIIISETLSLIESGELTWSNIESKNLNKSYDFIGYVPCSMFVAGILTKIKTIKRKNYYEIKNNALIRECIKRAAELAIDRVCESWIENELKIIGMGNLNDSGTNDK